MINWNDVLNDIISIIEPECVPVEYIVMVKFTDKNGIEHSLRGIELKNFMSEPGKTQAYEARIIVDVSKIKKTMMMDIVHFFDNLNSKNST